MREIRPSLLKLMALPYFIKMYIYYISLLYICSCHGDVVGVPGTSITGWSRCTASTDGRQLLPDFQDQETAGDLFTQCKNILGKNKFLIRDYFSVHCGHTLTSVDH